MGRDLLAQISRKGLGMGWRQLPPGVPPRPARATATSSWGAPFSPHPPQKGNGATGRHIPAAPGRRKGAPSSVWRLKGNSRPASPWRPGEAGVGSGPQFLFAPHGKMLATACHRGAAQRGPAWLGLLCCDGGVGLLGILGQASDSQVPASLTISMCSLLGGGSHQSSEIVSSFACFLCFPPCWPLHAFSRRRSLAIDSLSRVCSPLSPEPVVGTLGLP